jgi:hypothetical protein
MKVMLYELFTGQNSRESECDAYSEASTKHIHNPRISVEIFAPFKSPKIGLYFLLL